MIDTTGASAKMQRHNGMPTPADAAKMAAAKIAAGAALVQVYTGFIYAGPGLISESVRAIDRR